MGKILVSKNESESNRINEEAFAGARTISSLLKQHNGAVLVESIEDLKALFDGPEKYIVERRGLKNNDFTKQLADLKILEMLADPKPLELAKDVNEIRENFYDIKRVFNTLDLCNFKEGELHLDREKVNDLIEKANIYAESEKEKLVFGVVSEVLEGLDKLNKLVDTSANNFESTRLPFAEWNPVEKRFKLDLIWYNNHVKERN